MRKAALAAAAAIAVGGTGAAAAQDQQLSYVADQATWPHLDLSPDGKTLQFDVLGDIYRIPAKGGTARPVLTGDAWERDAVLSPDGQWMAFVSDRSGVTNLWVARPDGSAARQVSHDTSLVLYTSPAWAPDGQSIYISRAVHSVLAFELWRFPVTGGSGKVLVKAQPNGNEGWDDRTNALGAAPTPDGKGVYFATKKGHTWTEAAPPNWSIAYQDLTAATIETVIPGGMRPVLSNNGRLLAYAARFGAQTGLRLRDLASGQDRWLAFPVDRDGQEGGYYYDLLPRYEFTRDDKAIVLSRGGKFQRLDLAGGAMTAIAFKAPVKLALKRSTRVRQRVDSFPVITHVAEGAAQSPVTGDIVFTALGTLYRSRAEARAPSAVFSGDAFRPVYSQDGNSLFFLTWNADKGGQVMALPSNGGVPRPLTEQGSFWSEIVADRSGNAVLALRANQYERLRAGDELAPGYRVDIVWVPLDGGDAEVIAHGTGLRNLQQTRDGTVWAQTSAGLAKVVARTLQPQVAVVAKPFGQYVPGSAPVQDIAVSPDGRWLLARAASELHLVPMPESATAPVTIDLQGKVAGHRQITRIGADRAAWSADGNAIVWTLGADWRRITLDQALAVTDPEAAAQQRSLAVTVPRAMPAAPQVLRGATVITMDSGRIVPDADVVIEGDRIAAIGPAGSVIVPAGAIVRNVAGKFIIPGLIDAHAHFFAIRRGLHDGSHWEFPVNLAYGVTSALEVQAFTPDIFAYQDRVDAGSLVGPRIFSTGPGVFVNSLIDSVETAKSVLARYRDHYLTRNVKSYMVGDRAARQAMAEAAREMGLMPTTEGAADFGLGLTHAVDGFSGNEHTLPVTPIHDDVVRLFATTRISYTPTLGVLYGGAPALFDDIITKRMERDPRLVRFTPPHVMTADLRDRHWTPDDLQTYRQFAADALRIRRAGGLVGAGSHGEVQGLGLHWEMEAFVDGGATPLEALEIATMGSAETIGRQEDLGSLAPGKLADLVVLDADPRAAIANARAISIVMRGGIAFDGVTLAPLDGGAPAPARWWLDDVPSPKAMAR